MSKESNVISLSRWVRRFCILAFILFPLAFASSWWFVFESQEMHLIMSNIPVHFESVQWYQWGLAIFLSCIPVLLTILAIHHVYRLMKLFLQSEYFSINTSQRLHQFSFWLLISAIAKVISDALMSMILTMNNPSGGLLSVSLDSQTMGTLFIVSVFFVITRIMKEGIKLAKENAEFV